MIPATMAFRKLFAPLVLLSFVIFLTGCQNGGTQPSNPFAQNQTIPPPATFSSQELFLGQTPGAFVPQTPAATFPQPGSVPPIQVPPTQPTTPPPADIPFSDATNNSAGEGATLFAAGRETSGDTGWAPVAVAATSQTAFQAMDEKVNTASAGSGFQLDTPETLVVGTSHVVTTIVDETATLSEPQLLLYSGRYVE